MQKPTFPRSFWIILATLTFIVFVLETWVRAQEPLTPELALARICVSEAGWEATDDCAAIHHVLLRGAEHRGGGRRAYVSFASSYSHRLLTGDGQIQRPWLRQLDTSGSEPGLWGFRRMRDGSLSRVDCPPWRAYRERWMAVLERARTLVRERRLDDADEWSPCDEEPHHWGCPLPCVDHERATRAGWRQISCGNTVNEFWSTDNVVVD